MGSYHLPAKIRKAANQNKKERDYWLEQLSGDLPRSTFSPDYRGYGDGVEATGELTGEAQEIFRFSQEVFSALADRCRGNDYSLQIYMTAVLAVLLARYTGHDDIIIGTPIYRQENSGQLINTVLALRNRISGDMTFKQLLLQVRDVIAGAVENQDYPVELVAEQLNLFPGSAGEFPLFDAGICVEGIHDPGYFQRIKPNIIFSIRQDSSGLEVAVYYNRGQYREGTVRRITRNLQQLLTSALTNLDHRLFEIEILTPGEKQQILYEFNDTEAQYPGNETLHGLFIQRGKQYPDHVAVIGAGTRLPAPEPGKRDVQVTYRELHESSDALSYGLKEKGVGPDSIVAIMVEPGMAMIQGIFAILKAGSAYLPIDPEYPEERKKYMLKDSGAKILLTADAINRVPTPQRLSFHPSTLPPFFPSNPSNLAYIIYTSGTTGKPKGTLITHGNVVRLLFNDRFQFDFSHRDVWTLFHSYCFDFSVWEMYGALLYGGKLVIISRMTARDPGSYLGVLKKNSVTVLNQTPSAFYRLFEQERQTSHCHLHLEYVIFGGEALAPGQLKQWREKYPDTRLINMYGITETTVHVTYKEITPREIAANTSNIGKPIPTLTVYVLDKGMQLQPVGAVGELYVGGKGVARGYLNRPELTNQKLLRGVQGGGFLEKSLPGRRRQRLYKSGDLVKRIESGDMEYLGRIDHQVKIRGFRIEPGEIEKELLAHGGIKQTAVMVWQEQNQDNNQRFLCAYFVPRQTPGKRLNPGDLREYLQGRLPGYMIPAYFMPMDRIPLTPNGKIDRKQLPQPRTAIGIDYEAPEGEMGRRLAGIWQQALAVEKIGVKDNFFALGGDSMKAIKLIGSINQNLGTSLGVVDLYSYQTLGEMTGYLLKQSPAPRDAFFEEALREVEQFRERMMKHPRILSAARVEDVYPMSDIEKGMVFHYLRGAGQGVYHDQIVVQRDYRHFDPERMKRAVSLLVEKHPILRTGFFTEESTHVIYSYNDCFVNDITYHDISLLEKRAQEVYIKKYLSGSRQKGYDVFNGPLWRIGVFKCGGSLVILVWESHHAIIDGWSNASFLTELNNTYHRLESDPAYQPGKLKVGYKQFITHQEAVKRNPAVSVYWQDQLAGYKRLSFPPQPGPGQYQFSSFELGARVREQLETMAEKQRTSLKNLCLGAFIYALSMFTYEPDITVGVVTHNRPESEDGDKILGCFLNTVPFRLKIPVRLTWADYMGIVETRMVQLKKYEKLSLMEIAKRVGEAPDHSNPFFDIVFNLVDFHVYRELEGTGDVEEQEYRLELQSFARTNFLLEISIVTYGSELTFTLHFSTAFISREDAEKLYTFFNKVLEKFIYHPHAIVDKNEMIPVKEKRHLLYDLNNTAREYADDQTIHGLFSRQVQRTPDRVVLEGRKLQITNYKGDGGHREELSTCGDKVSITYKELNEKSGQLGYELRQKGVQPDTVVAIMIERSVEMIIGTTAILKAGGAYLPIEADLPRDRVDFMLKDSSAKILLTSREIAVTSWPQVLYLSEGRLFNSHPHHSSFINHHSKNLAYVIYTSGSTGKPKGVLVEHRSAVNILLCRKEIYKMNPGVTSLLLFSYSFDGFVTDFFTPVISGGRVILTGREERMDPEVIRLMVTGSSVTHIFCTPPLYRVIIEGLSKADATWLKVVTLGGDRLPLALLEATRQKNAGVEVVHEYGVTEAAVTSTLYRHQERDPQIKIGRPVWNTAIYILDRRQRLQPVGTAGEMCIGGAGVARGYLNRPELTAAKFDQDLWDYRDYHDEEAPFGQIINACGETNKKKPGKKKDYRSHRSYMSHIYRTGDLGRWLSDGTIEFLGRIDFQVKIRGFRIEPGEIENRLLSKSGIKNAVVVAKEDDRGNKYLCAYIVGSRDILELELKEYLSTGLPDYMVPAYFVFLDRIPLGSTGKVDSKGLPQPVLTAGAGYAAPRDEKEKQLVAVWQEVLGIDRVGIMDNFFQMGGDSIKAMQVVSRLKTRGLQLKINDLFSRPLIKQLAAGVTLVTGQIPQEMVEGEVLLTPIQRWFFSRDFTGGHHFNQSMMLYWPGGIDQGILKQVFTGLIQHHDALRMVYEEDRERGRVIQRNRGIDGKLFDLAVFNFEADDDAHIEQVIEKEAEVIQASIDITEGPLVKLGLFKTRQGDHLLIVIHHLVVDGVSWRILLEDIDTASRQVQAGEPINLSPKTTSFQHWSQKLSEYAQKQTTIKSFCGGFQMLHGAVFSKSAPLATGGRTSGEIDKNKKKLKYIEAVTLELNKADTQSLVTRVNRPYNTEINDILLTALGKAVKEWSGMDEVIVNLEGHGREPIMPDLDISRTVGWFTTQYPVILDMSRCDGNGNDNNNENDRDHDLSYAIKRVKETLRRIPHKGIEYGIWRYLAPREGEGGDFSQGEPEISFNYLGQMDSPGGGGHGSLFQFSSFSKGRSFSPEMEQFHTLTVTGMLVGGELSFSFAYNRHEYDRGTIDTLVRGFERNLLHIIDHCSRKQERELTPADVMNTSRTPLSLEEFTGIVNHIKDNIEGSPVIEAIYPLSSMQKGILYHWMTRTDYDVYMIQTLFNVKGRLEKSLLETALNQLIQRYDIFRTIFIYQGLAEPLQVVLRQRRLEVHHEDIVHLSEKEQAGYLEEWCQKEKAKGFELGKNVMMRLSLFKTGEEQYSMVWGVHHILMDGWCLGIIFNEVVEIYRDLAAGTAVREKEVIPYRNYIEWIEEQDKAAGLNYWEKYLAGYNQQAGLPKLKSVGAVSPGVYQPEEIRYEISREDTAGLMDFFSGHQVTLNTVIQGVWGLVLQRYNNSNDVVFGAVVSGRPAEIPGIEGMIGLFINTIPVRVRSDPDQVFFQLVKALQEESSIGKAYEYLPLPDILTRSEVKSGLIDHILVFENYPFHEQVKHKAGKQAPGVPGAALDWQIQDITVFEQTNYDFYITIIPGESILVKLNYNSLVYERELINRVGLHIKEILCQVRAAPAVKLKEIGILTAGEKQQILFEFNRAPVSYPAEKVLHDLFAEQTERTPDNIAVIGKMQSAECKAQNAKRKTPCAMRCALTYRQLNERSNRLARVLPGKGVQADTIVGIMAERSPGLIIGLLAILKAGGAYLPVDPDYPQDRIDFMLKDSKVKILVKNSNVFCDFVIGNGIEVISIDEVMDKNRPRGTSSHLRLSRRVNESVTTAPSSSTLASSSTCQVSPANLAYIIYTSGSTGKPKGTVIRHKSVVNRLVWMQKEYPITGQDVILQKTPITFDVSVWELFWWGTAGARCCLLEPGGEKDPEAIVKAVELNRVSVIHFVPSMLGAFIDYIAAEGAAARLTGLRQVFASGEALSTIHVNRFNQLIHQPNRTRLTNLYGPTEATVDVSYFDCPPGENLDRVPIGKPIDNIGLFVLDRQGRLQSVGMPGELCITGVGLAQGYLNRPELTAAKFDQDLWDDRDYQDSEAPSGQILNACGGGEAHELHELTPIGITSNGKLLRGVQGGGFLEKSPPGRRRQKAYKTGDLVRWLADGNIEFLGRIDFQVKIRGFRIEPGEIETRLLKKPGIKNAVVQAREDKPGNSYLCAYIVAEGEISTLGLQEYLSTELPSYMIPAYFIFLDRVPLTSSGKVDRRALPAPGRSAVRDYVPPRNEVEKRLVEVWQEVLDLEGVGITDNFLAVGGDSIKAILVVSRLKKYGLNLKINDIFAKPVIKQLAACVTAVTREIPQEPVQGEVPLTPIQYWFFQSYQTHRHHFNQAVMLYRAGGFDESSLKQVFTRLVEHHDALRMVFAFSRVQGEEVIIQKNRDLKGKLFDLEVFNFGETHPASSNVGGTPLKRGIKDIQKEIETEVNRMQASIDLENAPLVKLGLFKTPVGDHLLIVIHHLVIDGVSWRILLEDFKTAYKQVQKGRSMNLPPKTDSFQHWSGKLSEYAQKQTIIKSFCGGVQMLHGAVFSKRGSATPTHSRSDRCRSFGASSQKFAENTKFQKVLVKSPPLAAGGRETIKRLPRDRQIDNKKKILKHIEVAVLDLSQAETQRLLKRVNQAYNTEINDILLTALGLAIKEWAGIEDIFIHLEGHGRGSIIEDVDINRTVGWFTALYPVILDMTQCKELSYAIKHVKETLRRIPYKGIGYGILKYLTPGKGGKGGSEDFVEEEPEISFNYLGQFSPGEGADKASGTVDQTLFAFSPLGTGRSASPGLAQHYTLNINGMMVEGKLSLSFAYNRLEYDKSTIRSLVDNYKRNLQDIIRHCSEKQERELTPADVMDVSYMPMSLEEFAGILDYIKTDIPGHPAIQAVYPLNPMQRGMFYHWLNRGRYDMYLIQTQFWLEGRPEASRLEAIFNRLIQRYDIFRTIFIYRGLEEPRQVVLSHRQTRVYYEDILHLAGEAQARYLEEWSQKEKEKGFDLSKDVMMKLALFKTGENRYRLIWEFHHILMDGWCLGIVFNEMVEIYAAAAAGKEIRLEEVIPYGSYIEWWVKQDKEASLNYWEGYLAGYQQQAGLPRLSTGKKEGSADYRPEEYDFEIGKEETRGLADLAGKNQVTLNTVFQALWGLVLQKYNNADDVVFGAVVSGRPPGLPGVERMVGLFINTIPVRVISRPGQGFDQLLRRLQQGSTAGKSHEYLPLADIQSKSQLKANLIDHILIFENYPLYRQLKNTSDPRLPGSPGPGPNFRVKNTAIKEQTNYDFNIVIIPGETIGMKLSFNGLVYDLSLIRRVESHLKKILGQVLKNPGIKLKEMEILTLGEKQGILFNFNRQEVSYPREKTIHDLFVEQAVRTPDNIALLEPQQTKYRTAVISISYRELNDRSNQLAYDLIKKGVQTDTIVGIMMDRCPEMIIGILGILKAGGAYLPIDPDYPKERIDYMLADSGARVLVSEVSKLSELSDVSEVSGGIEIIDLHQIKSKGDFPTHLTQLNLAYIIYTSGSTGRPKGVMVGQSSVVNILVALQNSYPLMESDVYLLKTSFIFDVSVTELFGWFLGGGRLAVLEKGGEKDPGKILDTIAREGVTHINFVPSMFNVFLEVLSPENADKLSGLRYIFLAGEALLPGVVEKYTGLGISTSIALENIYGPTEGTIYSTGYGLSQWKGEEVIPIGKPMPNTRVYILDQYNRLQPIGVPGELCIAGIGLARGYLNRPELTAEKFDQDLWDYLDYHDKKAPFGQVQNAFGEGEAHELHELTPIGITSNGKLLRGVQGGGFLEKSPPGRRRQKAYKTGDLARWLADGNIEFLGRIDFQVKIRGFRIEPGEIENRLLKKSGIKNTLVLAKKDERNDQYLCAYIVSDQKLDLHELRKSLAAELPMYMIPAYFIPIHELPLAPSGKIDRKSLPDPGIETLSPYVAPRDQIEKELVAIWSQLLGIDSETISIEANFFEMGGHSLKATIMASQIYKTFNVEVSIKEIFKALTIKAIAAIVKTLTVTDNERAVSRGQNEEIIL